MGIALVTPVRDEIDNLPKIFAAIADSEEYIHTWVILENDSVDGSKEYLSAALKPDNVGKLIVLNNDTDGEGYQLGFKYSRIIKQGFDYLSNLYWYDEIQYVGILDCDCFPRKDYYTKIVRELESNSSVGVVSGVLVSDGIVQKAAKDFPRGCCRIWRKDCLSSAGYIVGMSADSISTIKALQSGWLCKVVGDAYVDCREVGGRVGHQYYGKAAYYRGETLTFSVLKALSMLFQGPHRSYGYLYGYVSSMVGREDVINDTQVLSYSRGKLGRKVKDYILKWL